MFMSLMSATDAFLKINLKLTDNLYTQSNLSTDQITIVTVDTKSLLAQNLGAYRFWPRTNFANVISEINKNNPSVIGLDFIFDSASKTVHTETIRKLMIENQNDISKFTIELANYLNNIHPYDLELSHALEKSNSYTSTNSFLSEYDKDLDLLKSSNTKLNSIKVLQESQKGDGIVNIKLDKDGIARKIPVGIVNQDKWTESLPLVIAREFLNAEASKKEKDYGLYNFSEEIKIPTQEGQMLINYSGPPESYKWISFIDVLNGKYDPEDFQDKIVLVGATDTTFHDNLATPYEDFLPMPGVEIHANAIQTILDGKFLRYATTTETIGIIFLLTLLITTISIFVGLLPGVITTVVVGGLYYLSAHLMFDRGVILNMLYPFLAIIAAYVASIAYMYFTEIKEKQKIKGMFGKYVSPDVVNALTKNPELAHLGGKKKVITVLFSDIKDFTTISEQMDPAALTNQLNQYLDLMTKVVIRNGGTLDKFEGDAIMCFWNAPLDEPNHAILACKTALEMKEALKKFLHPQWQKDNAVPGNDLGSSIKKPLLDFRVGIATGEAIVGNMGSTERFDYTVIGDTVNTGARLEQANKEVGSEILVNDKTQELTKAQFAYSEPKQIMVKGKTEKLTVYALTGVKAQ